MADKQGQGQPVSAENLAKAIFRNADRKLAEQDKAAKPSK